MGLIGNERIGLEVFDVEGYWRHVEDKKLPEIVLSNNYRVTEVPDLPEPVRSIVINNCPGLRKLPKSMKGLTSFTMIGGEWILELPEFSDALTAFTISFFTILVGGLKFSKSLTSLVIRDCPGIDSVTVGDLTIVRSCDKVQTLPQHPGNLLVVDAREVKIGDLMVLWQ